MRVFPLKQVVLDAVRIAGHEPIDVGTHSADPVDFPDYSEKVGRAVQNGEAERGILVCGSGVGACIAANKMKGVYASICHDTYSAAQGVLHDDMNVLCLGGRVVGPELASALVKHFWVQNTRETRRAASGLPGVLQRSINWKQMEN
jgi:ribose 5-phosphate isomerase B